jgi:plastocyanin
VTFDKFARRLNPQDGGHNAWRFSRHDVTLGPGQTLTAINTGGETHTFTMVAAFGPGFVPFLNALVFPGQSQVPIPEFTMPFPAATLASFVPAGAPALTINLAPGTYLFECGIHPWMRTTVTVEGT